MCILCVPAFSWLTTIAFNCILFLLFIYCFFCILFHTVLCSCVSLLISQQPWLIIQVWFCQVHSHRVVVTLGWSNLVVGLEKSPWITTVISQTTGYHRKSSLAINDKEKTGYFSIFFYVGTLLKKCFNCWWQNTITKPLITSSFNPCLPEAPGHLVPTII